MEKEVKVAINLPIVLSKEDLEEIKIKIHNILQLQYDFGSDEAFEAANTIMNLFI